MTDTGVDGFLRECAAALFGGFVRGVLAMSAGAVLLLGYAAGWRWGR